VSFVAITFRVAPQRAFIVDVVVVVVAVDFVIDSVRKRLDTPSYFSFSAEKRQSRQVFMGLAIHRQVSVKLNLQKSDFG
jgi:hypothetical protein